MWLTTRERKGEHLTFFKERVKSVVFFQTTIFIVT
jgi:hypothetical protein